MDHDGPRAVLLDHGELDDVRSLLTALEVEHCDAAESTLGVRVPLLLSAPAHARALADGTVDAPPHQLHVAICRDPDEIDAPCDLALLRPLDPAALRLLTRREAATDRRLATRVALGVPVKVRVEADSREVILERISISGCALISRARVMPGTRLEIELPPELHAPRSLLLSGQVRSSREIVTADGLTFDVSVAFEELDLRDRVTLRALMARHSIDFRPPSEGPSLRSGRRLQDRGRARPDNGHALRRRYQRRVMGVCDGVAHILMARDLSRGGVGIESDERLGQGDRLKLALYAGRGAPILATASVERSNGADGGFLRFDLLDPEVTRRLGHVLEVLAPVDLDSGFGASGD